VPAGGEDIVDRLVVALGYAGPVARVDAARIDREVGTGAATSLPGTTLAAQVTAWLEAVEAAHATVVLVGGARRWTARCVRAADETVVLAAGPRQRLAPVAAGIVAVVRRSGAPPQRIAATWLDVASSSRIVHVDASSDADVRRLARFARGEAVGVVLGGGGARGLAHLGVLRALEASDVPIDAIGGTSIGALMAACLAVGWDHDTRLAKSIAHLVEAKRLLGWTLPLVSLSSAAKLTRMLRSDSLFAERAIEDLPVPFFAISASLTTGAAVVHDRGPLWLASRASISLPGFLPPVPFDGDLLVDGGVVNNVPVDVMRARGAGRVLASNLRGAPPVYPDGDHGPSLSGWRVLARRLQRRPMGLPDPATTMLRAKELTAWAAHEERLLLSDLVIEPPVDGVDNLRFAAALPLVELAYAHTMKVLECSDDEDRLQSTA
jgi:NTE family protein